MSNIVAINFKEERINAIKRQEYRRLCRRIPYVLERQQKLHELHAPRSVLDNEMRLVCILMHRFARLKRWIGKQKQEAEATKRLFRYLFQS
jgi:hypothetical protein